MEGRQKKGRLLIVGIGPGGGQRMTQEAAHALEESECIVGYGTYAELVKPLFPEKEYLTSGMRREEERCRTALLAASAEGKTVALICSGDPGVYGMAGLAYELSRDYAATEITVIPGVTAACSGAALLGAPLMHDFAVISLSDLLTPWEKIERRLRGAASADMVIVLYNPGSRTRTKALARACAAIAPYVERDRVCGIAERIGREGERTALCTFGALAGMQPGMDATVFIGNSETKEIDGKMVTPRGYVL